LKQLVWHLVRVWRRHKHALVLNLVALLVSESKVASWCMVFVNFEIIYEAKLACYIEVSTGHGAVCLIED
jgi:hypothetical protein